MIALLKFLDCPWEQARGYLREDLDHLEIALNQRFGSDSGPVAPVPQTVTLTAASNYQVAITDYIVQVTTPGAVVVLPTVVGNKGRVFIVDNASSGAITVTTLFPSQTIQGATSQVVASDDTLSVYSDGTRYRIIL